MNMFGPFGGGPFGDPRHDGGGWVWGPFGWVWVPPGPLPSMGTHPALAFLDALHDSLDDKSDESFHKALSSSENAAAIARLYKSAKKSTQALWQELARLQEELHRPGANKPAILRRIAAILEQLEP